MNPKPPGRRHHSPCFSSVSPYTHDTHRRIWIRIRGCAASGGGPDAIPRALPPCLAEILGE